MLLDQKYNNNWGHDIKDHNDSLGTNSKKRTFNEISHGSGSIGQDKNTQKIQQLQDRRLFTDQEGDFAFKIETLYKVQDIIEGFNIHVILAKTSYELEIEL